MSDHHPDRTESQETPLDEWHEHPAEQGVPQVEHGAHANTQALMLVFGVVTVSTVVFCVVIGMFAINQFNKLKAEREAAGFGAAVADAAAYKKEALAAQSGYGWTADGNVRLPIDQAMEMTVQRYEEKQGR